MEAAVRSRFLRLLAVVVAVIAALIVDETQGAGCGPPPIPRNAKIANTNLTLNTGSSTQYICDPGFELFGADQLTCSEEGRWKGPLPLCAVNVAYRRPANQSTTVRGGPASNAVDGNQNALHEGKYCSETRKESSPWWRVDLLRAYDVRAIRVVAPSGGQHRVEDIEIRVGNSTTLSRNRLCAWQPGTLEGGQKKEFLCARASIGRYVFLQMVGVEGALSLCEVQVFTDHEISQDRCSTAKSGDRVRSFDSVCYDFRLTMGSDFQGARAKCQAIGGDLVHNIDNVTKNFLIGELEMVRNTMTTQLVWIGANKEPGTSHTWHWVGGGAVAQPMWGEEQPNNYNGEQNCVVLDGNRGWLWNDVGCNLNYLPWVCQYDPPICGSPDRNENTTIRDGWKEGPVGALIEYQCPPHMAVIGNGNRTCLKDGSWSGVAPTCKYVDCGRLEVANGLVEFSDNRTTFDSTARYSCNDNYTLTEIQPLRTCRADGRWSGATPACLYKFCPEPSAIINGSLRLSDGLVIGSVGHFTCSAGHRIVGHTEMICQAGGMWSSATPKCEYVDCGQPRKIANGIVALPFNNTLLQSEVVYLCKENHRLKGVDRRKCLDNGTWSREEPTCELITCGTPDVRSGSYVVVESLEVGATAEYFCDPGHAMEGQSNRTCTGNGTWSHEAPRCRFVECGRVPHIPHGQVDYINSTTQLNDVVSYTCAQGYRIIGNGTRVCDISGRWSGSTPTCEEIRCTEPNRPPNAVLSVSGNDRFGDGDTFKVGSTVQFRCEKGYKVHGGTMLTCERDGIWTGAPPVCLYVDCLFPEPIANGELTLLSNTTYYGSTAEYVCQNRYELIGMTKRSCQDNGTWEGQPPRCQEINCGPPDKPPSVNNVEVESFTVDSVAIYRCSPGQRVAGNQTRVCMRTGRWSGNAASCDWVDCGRPTSPQNGEIYLLNQSTTYMSVMEYHCFFGYKLVGPSIRSCKEDGLWNSNDGKCELDTSNNDVLGDNSLTKPVASAGAETESDIVMSKTIGVAIGVGAGGVLLLTIIIALVYMKLRRPKPTLSMSEEALRVQSSPRDISHPIAAYANMETDLSDSGSGSNNIGGGGGGSAAALESSQNSNGTTGNGNGASIEVTPRIENGARSENGTRKENGARNGNGSRVEHVARHENGMRPQVPPPAVPIR